MPTRVSIDGTLCTETEAHISILDRGFLYGDSVYEVLRTYAGFPFATEEHLARLRQSAASIFLSIPWSNELLTQELHTLLRSLPWKESYLRLIITRGEGQDLALDPALATTPRRIWLARPYVSPPAALYQEGATVCTIQHTPSPLAGRKTGNYLTNILALREAKQRGAYEAWLYDEQGKLYEGANSNLFLVSRNVLYTPPCNAPILAGITRATVLQLATELGFTVHEQEIPYTNAYQAEEAFLCSTLREIMPVTKIDDVMIGRGVPGVVTEQLHQAFRKLVGGVAPGA